MTGRSSTRRRRLLWLIAFLIASIATAYFTRHQTPFVLFLFVIMTMTAFVLVTIVRGSYLQNAMFLGAIVFLSLAAAESYFHDFDAVRARNRGATWEGTYMSKFFAEDAELGYSIAPAKRTYERIKRASNGKIIYAARYSIGPNGLRVTSDVPGPVAYFFGCSMTFGNGIDDKDTLPEQFSRLSKYHAINLAAPGYGTHHMVRELEIDRPAALNVPRPDIVIYVAIMDHINRAAGRGVGWDDYGPRYDVNGVYQGPFHRRGDPKTLVEQFDFALRFWWHTYDAVRTQADVNYFAQRRTPDELNRFVALVTRARDLVTALYHVPFVVVFWDLPSDVISAIRQQSGGEADRLVKHLEAHRINVLRLSKVWPDSNDAKYYIPMDGHPNAAGDAKVAAALNDWLSNYLRRTKVGQRQ